ncbi:hypothetical protein EVAR_3440_1 [Eumeta japonica]|uniref:Uncharacterized protein n=1 Tax=Eumeta variegata TaxID=151549 RepID=A0A4C1ST77_EUMVA|nr:hypothetical protein EVAR_3440_1 [Eumeta japonica]
MLMKWFKAGEVRVGLTHGDSNYEGYNADVAKAAARRHVHVWGLQRQGRRVTARARHDDGTAGGRRAAQFVNECCGRGRSVASRGGCAGAIGRPEGREK